MTTSTFSNHPKTFTVVHYLEEKDVWRKSRDLASKADAKRLCVLYEALGHVALVHVTQALYIIGMPEGAPSVKALEKARATRAEHARNRAPDSIYSQQEQTLWDEINALLAS